MDPESAKGEPSYVTCFQTFRGIFKSVSDLQDAIRRYIREHNDAPKSFVWTKPAKTILAKLNRLPVTSV